MIVNKNFLYSKTPLNWSWVIEIGLCHFWYHSILTVRNPFAGFIANPLPNGVRLPYTLVVSSLSVHSSGIYFLSSSQLHLNSFHSFAWIICPLLDCFTSETSPSVVPVKVCYLLISNWYRLPNALCFILLHCGDIFGLKSSLIVVLFFKPQ